MSTSLPFKWRLIFCTHLFKSLSPKVLHSRLQYQQTKHGGLTCLKNNSMVVLAKMLKDFQLSTSERIAIFVNPPYRYSGLKKYSNEKCASVQSIQATNSGNPIFGNSPCVMLRIGMKYSPHELLPCTTHTTTAKPSNNNPELMNVSNL